MAGIEGTEVPEDRALVNNLLNALPPAVREPLLAELDSTRPCRIRWARRPWDRSRCRDMRVRYALLPQKLSFDDPIRPDWKWYRSFHDNRVTQLKRSICRSRYFVASPQRVVPIS